MLHIYMKYEAPHSLSTGENMFLANLSQHKQHDTMDVAEIWSPYHGGWQTHHQTFEFQKKNNLPSFFPWNATPKKDKKKQNSCLQEELVEVFVCVCVFWFFFVLIAPNLKKPRQPRAIPASHGLLKMRKASRPFGLDIENDKVNRPRKPVGSRRLIHRGRGDGWKCLYFFCQHTSHANSKSQESYVFFFHLPCFMLSCHLNLFQKLQSWANFFCTTQPVVSWHYFYLGISAYVSTTAITSRIILASLKGTKTRNRHLSGAFFEAFWQLKFWIGFCLG